LRQQVIDDVQAAGPEKRKRIVQVIELPGPGVGENEVKLVVKAREKRGTIGDMKANAPVVPEIAASDVNHRSVVVNCVVEQVSIPERSHELPTPVPVPSSNRAPLGLEAARLRKSDPVSSSEAMRNPAASVARRIFDSASGKSRFQFSFIEDG
jgi:hypothetical protein